jgi:hypothetical protein
MRELNLIVDTIPSRDPELGIGRHVAWQIPLHIEAIRKTLKEHK